jgi:HEAT repeat protein
MTTPAAEGVSRILDTLVEGVEMTDAALRAFSDVDREAEGMMRARWHEIPLTARRLLLARAAALAVQDIHLDFRSLALAALGDEEAAVRRLAIGALWESEHRDVASGLLQALRQDSDDSVRAAAAASLKRFVLARELEIFETRVGDDIVGALRQVAERGDEPTEVRARAVEALGPRSTPWMEALIRDCYYHEERELRMAAVVAMGESADERWLEYLYEQMQSDDPEFRSAAAVACGVIGAEESVEEVAALLDDKEPTVVVEAVRSLGEIGGEEAAEYLRAFEERAPEDILGTIEEAVEAAEGLIADDAE